MDEEYIKKQLAHIKGLLSILDDGQKIVIERKGDKLEYTVEDSFV